MLRLKQPDSTGACCCRTDCGPCVTGPSVEAGACVSRTGNASLCGWSKFDNYNAGDWNKLRWLEAVFSGSVIGEAYVAGTGCSTFVLYFGPDTWSGTAIADPSGCTVSQYGTLSRSSCGDALDITPANGIPDIPQTCYDGTPVGCSSCGSAANTEYTRTLTANGCDCSDGDCQYGSATCVLTVPDTVQDALERASVSPGTLCKTTAGSGRGAITAGAQLATTSTTGTTAVAVPLSCTGLTASTDYEITVSINRYTAGGGAYVDTIQDTITFTAGDTTAEMDYHVPVNTDYDYEWNGVVSIAAA